jgi:hypothetical protein
MRGKDNGEMGSKRIKYRQKAGNTKVLYRKTMNR